MKRIKVLSVLMATVVFLCFVVIVSYAVKSKTLADDFQYEILEDNSAKITGLKCDEHMFPSRPYFINIEIPSEIDNHPVKIIGESAFENVYFISLSVPESIEVIEKRAFCDAHNLKTVEFSEGLKEIGELAFAGCESLEKAVLPEGLVELGHDAFAACASLEEITVTAENVGSGAFSDCSSLKKVKMSDNVKSLGMCAFYGCSSLEELVLGRNTEFLGTALFQGCINMKRILIPQSVTTFEENNIFFNDVNVETIYGFRNSPAESYANMKNISFTDITNACLYFDLNLDGTADEEDFEFISQAIITGGFCSEIENTIADINGDGVVDGFDASALERRINSH